MASAFRFEVLPPRQSEALEALAGVADVARFHLAGGTAIALRLGHRETEDFDFYAPAFDDPAPLAEALARAGHLAITKTADGTLIGMLGGVKVSFFRYRYDLLDPVEPLRGAVHLAGMRDLAAMKMIAIGQRGLRRDFVDIHALLRAGFSLREMLDWTRMKYRDLSISEYHLRRSLTYFDDAEAQPMPRMRLPVAWEEVRRTIEREVAALPLA